MRRRLLLFAAASASGFLLAGQKPTGPMMATTVVEESSSSSSPQEASVSPRSDARAWFEAAMAASSGSSEVVEAAREMGREILSSHPELLPNKRAEPWRFTDLEAIWKRSPTEVADGEMPRGDSWYLTEASVLVCVVDGVVVPELSRGLGGDASLFVGSVSEAPPDADAGALAEPPPEVALETAGRNSALGSAPWAALNAACMEDAVIITASKDAEVHVVHCSTGRVGVAHPRLAVSAKGDAKLLLHQTFVASAPAVVNSRTTIDVDDEAELTHVYCATQGPATFHFEASTTNVRGAYAGVAVAVGGDSRLGMDFSLAKPHAKVEIDTLVLAAGTDNVDLRTQVRHDQPNAESRQDVRNVAADGGAVTFKGRISVPAIAQGTDAAQLCRSALLTDDANVNVMPSLEIIADNVKCSHGATVADLDDDAIFFLMARGVPRDTAKALLIKGFCDSLLEALPLSTNPGLRPIIDAKIRDLVA